MLSVIQFNDKGRKFSAYSCISCAHPFNSRELPQMISPFVVELHYMWSVKFHALLNRHPNIVKVLIHVFSV